MIHRIIAKETKAREREPDEKAKKELSRVLARKEKQVFFKKKEEEKPKANLTQ
jgi:hypothetical protein